MFTLRNQSRRRDEPSLPSRTFFKSSKPATPPPQWTPAPERRHTLGRYNEATEEDCTDAEAFCQENPVDPAKPLPSAVVERIQKQGCRAWTLEAPVTSRFVGKVEDGDVIKLSTGKNCEDVCVMSNLPIVGGLYDTRRKKGVYYEVQVNQMHDVVAVGEHLDYHPLPLSLRS